MLNQILSLMGWPICAKAGCGAPSLMKIEFKDESSSIWVDVCAECVFEMGTLLEEVGTLKDENKKLLTDQNIQED